MPQWDGHPTWAHKVCESCLKNAGDRVEMIPEEHGSHIQHLLVCPQCGATKRL